MVATVSTVAAVTLVVLAQTSIATPLVAHVVVALLNPQPHLLQSRSSNVISVVLHVAGLLESFSFLPEGNRNPCPPYPPPSVLVVNVRPLLATSIALHAGIVAIRIAMHAPTDVNIVQLIVTRCTTVAALGLVSRRATPAAQVVNLVAVIPTRTVVVLVPRMMMMTQGLFKWVRSALQVMLWYR